jgi:serine palmitoyltransferase
MNNINIDTSYDHIKVYESVNKFKLMDIISPNFIYDIVNKFFTKENIHLVVETILVILIFLILFSKKKVKKIENKLTSKENDDILKNWSPEPLVPSISLPNHKILNVKNSPKPLLEVDNSTFLNFVSFNYLGLTTNPHVLNVGIETIKKYAVGSCGPRGFYGTMDIHLNFEDKISKLFSTKKNPVECVLYADYLACPSSVITSFAKSGDLIIADENITWLFKQGFKLSKANVIYYKHNDLNDLEKVLQNIQQKDNLSNNLKLNRRFIVTEGIFHSTGQMINLPKLIDLKNFYKYRLIVDDSHGFGTISKFGIPDFYNVDTGEIDVYVCAMDKAIGSVGGFVVGDKEISDHQRLSSYGYVYSASGPPFQISSASQAIDLLSDALVNRLQQNIKTLYTLLKNLLTKFRIESNKISPIIYLSILKSKNPAEDIQNIYEYCLKNDVFIFCTNSIPKDKYRLIPSLRISITANHSEKQLLKISSILKQSEQIILNE